MIVVFAVVVVVVDVVVVVVVVSLSLFFFVIFVMFVWLSPLSLVFLLCGICLGCWVVLSRLDSLRVLIAKMCLSLVRSCLVSPSFACDRLFFFFR